MGGCIEIIGVSLDLVLKAIVSDTRAGINDLLDEDGDLLGVVREAENKVARN